jgi:dynein regulatory complex protein 1
VRRKTEERIIKIKTDTEELDRRRRGSEEKAKKERANKIQNEVI